MTTTEQITKGQKFYEGDHTEWTFMYKTDDGFRFRTADGFEKVFAPRDLVMLSSVKGSEQSAF